MSFFAPVEVNRAIKAVSLVNENKQIVCACKLPVTRKNPKGSVAQCTNGKCGVKIFMTHLETMCKANCFAQWPKISIPLCKACNGMTLMLTKSKEGDYKVPTVRCNCKAWSMYTIENDPEAFKAEFWNLDKCKIAIDESVPEHAEFGEDLN